MTDVPFTAFTVLSLLFFVRSLQFSSTKDLLIGSYWATFAILCRQIGLFLPITFGMTFLIKNGFKPRNLYHAIIPIILGSFALFGFEYWLRINEKTPALYGNQMHSLLNRINTPKMLPLVLARNSFVASMYIGLFLLPIVVLLLFLRAEDKQSLWLKIGTIPICVSLAIVFIVKGNLMPVGGNVLDRTGIGPLTLRDVNILHLSHVPALPNEFWIVVTMLSILGGALILTYLISKTIFVIAHIHQLHRDNNIAVTFFFLSGAFVYFFPISLSGFFDRYLIPLIVLFSLSLA